MRKQTKLVAVLSAAALLAIGASMTSFAAKGWTQEDGQWYYYDNSGDYVYDEWKKSGNNYFYLGDEGYMLTNSLIQDGDNYYYVDANGAMVKNQWIQIAADDSEDQDVEYRWYYFGSTGRAYRSTSGSVQRKTINGKKYAFDTEGKMLFGFVTEDGTMTNLEVDPVLNADYYFGSNEDGAMYTGWLNYTEGLDDADYDGEDSLWFYYSPTTGLKEHSRDKKKIGKYYYSFDENGVMGSGWTDTATNSNGATVSKYFSGSDEGWMQRNTWVWAVPSTDIDAITGADDNRDDISRWFYVDSKGETVVDQAKRINSKWYVFDKGGRMRSGLIVLDLAGKNSVTTNAKIDSEVGKLDTDAITGADLMNGNEDYRNLFYFSADEEKDGAMKTGSNIRIELSDDTYTFGFAKSGQAYTGVENNKLYVNGVLVTAGDMRYAVANDYEGETPVPVVVGSSGTVVKAKKVVKDADDNYYGVKEGGEIGFFEACDEASAAARAFAAGKTEFTYSGTTHTVEEFREAYNVINAD